MDLHLSSSSSSDSDSDSDTVELVVVVPRINEEHAAEVGELAREFAQNVVSEGSRNVRAEFSTRVEVKGASARVVPRPGGLQLIDVALSVPFVDQGHRRLLFLRLQQELLALPAAVDRLSFVRVDDPLLALRPTMERLFGWHLTDAEDGDEPHAPRHRFWTWHRPASIAGMESVLVGRRPDEAATYAPVSNLTIYIQSDAFIRAPLQDAQAPWDGFEDASTPTSPSYIRNPLSFGVFFAHIVAHCRALGNAELELGSDLLVLSISDVTLSGPVDPHHTRAFMRSVIAFARVFVRPLFIHQTALDRLAEAARNDLFALVEEQPTPHLVPVTDEDYWVWIPDDRRSVADDDSQPLVIEEEEEEEDAGPQAKRQRTGGDVYGSMCAHCRKKNARFRMSLLPMCSQRCVRDFYMFH